MPWLLWAGNSEKVQREWFVSTPCCLGLSYRASRLRAGMSAGSFTFLSGGWVMLAVDWDLGWGCWQKHCVLSLHVACLANSQHGG